MAKGEIREWAPKKPEAPAAVTPQEAKPPAKPKEKPPEPEKLLVGKEVVVHFMDGTALAGTMASMHQYTFVLEHEGKKLLIYKHGVKLIEGLPA
ncbi:MAG: RNA chaperone Hfq [Candidatus Bipolaricaulota bacterium]|nr:RNA chaperone Hfq [Candidatus Bipolaricaulota bacterium]MDW8127059.1 RNA chaperone Hfq [Candidatus Bipolaricaulota bacterium]